MADKWTEERMRAFARLAASKKQKSRALTQEERSTARVQTQDWLGDDPQKGLFSWKGSIQATQDSVHAGLKLPLYQRLARDEKEKSRDPEMEALERKSKKATYSAQYQKSLIQQEKTKIEKRLTELDQKIIDGTLTPDERRERNRLKYKSEEGDVKSPYETVMKGIEQKREIEDILWEWDSVKEDWARDDLGNKVPNPELSPDQRAILYDRYVQIGKEADLSAQVNRLKSAGLVTSVEELKKVNEQTIESARPAIIKIGYEMLSRNVPEKIVGIWQKTTVSLIEKGLDKDSAMKKAYQDIKTMFPEYFR